MKKLLSLTAILYFAVCFAQKQNENWYFGFNAGLNFSTGEAVALTDNQIFTNEGTSTVSDAQGNLLFYTNGVVVYNRNHQIMENGNNLSGSFSSAQSSLIVQKPGSATIYYIFTTGSMEEPNIMGYSEVDITLDGGLGAITSKKNIELLAASTEHLTSTYHNNGKDIWVLTNDKAGLFNAFLVTANEVSTIPVTSPGIIYNEDVLFSEIGHFKVSGDGSKLASTQYENGFWIHHFDNSTGKLGDLIFSKDEALTWYGVEFSPSGRFIYFSKDETGTIVQYDLEDANIATSAVDVMNVNFIDGGGLQIAQNGKIYCTHLNFTTLSVIHSPDVKGLGCNAQPQAVNLGTRRAFLGLPSLFLIPVDLQIIAENTCEGNAVPVSFTSSISFDSVSWDFGDGTTSSATNPSHLYTAPGTYTITLTGRKEGMNRVEQMEITIWPAPDAGLETVYTLCSGSTLTLTAPLIEGSYTWSTGSTDSTALITSGGSYSVTIAFEGGCQTVHTFIVNEVNCDSIPKGISPNGDNRNDNFNLAHMTVHRISIYNRYGSEVYASDNYVDQWYGQTNEGKELPAGTYYYTIDNSRNTYTGWVYLNRQIN